MNTKQILVGALIGFLLGATVVLFTSKDKSFGGVTNYDSITLGADLIVGADATVTDDLTVSGGVLNVTTANTATSSITVGCFQFYATSTATAHKFMASTTPGPMYSVYGTCP